MRIARRLGSLALAVAVTSGLALAAGAPAQAASAATTTQLMVPQAMQTGASTVLAASVQASTGSAVPSGTVNFFTSSGTLIGSALLTPVAGSTFAAASISYTVPNFTGTTWYNFSATYVPDAGFAASSSGQVPGVAYVTPTRVNALVPPKVTLNAPALTFVLVNPAINGTAAFKQNGVALNDSRVTVTGNLTPYVWTPTVAGAISWTADFSSTDGTVSGESTVPTFVLPANPANTVTISGAPATGSIGQQVTLSASSANGNPVTLSAGGPCALTGTTLSLKGAGTCTITGVAAGSGAYSAGSATATVTVAQGTQTATVPAPRSGKVNDGATLTLSRPSTKTNLGTAVTWRVTKGSSVCTVSRSSGTTTLKVKKAGSCTVVGSAAAVPGQWSAFSTSRTYTAR